MTFNNNLYDQFLNENFCGCDEVGNRPCDNGRSVRPLYDRQGLQYVGRIRKDPQSQRIKESITAGQGAQATCPCFLSHVFIYVFSKVYLCISIR